MTYRTLKIVRQGPAVKVSLHRPEARNALNRTMIEELRDCFHALAEDENLRVVILAGDGKVFCAGADVRWMEESRHLSPEANEADARALARMLSAVEEVSVPVIAVVHGVAYGGGLGLCAACDIIVSTRSCRFCFAEVRLGIIPAVISTTVLRKISLGRARRYYLTGEVFSAQTARELGLVHEVTSPEELGNQVREIAAAFFRVGPQAVRKAKVFLRRWPGIPENERTEFAVRTAAEIRVTEEAQEGFRAFLEKRAPSYTIDAAFPDFSDHESSG